MKKIIVLSIIVGLLALSSFLLANFLKTNDEKIDEKTKKPVEVVKPIELEEPEKIENNIHWERENKFEGMEISEFITTDREMSVIYPKEWDNYVKVVEKLEEEGFEKDEVTFLFGNENAFVLSIEKFKQEDWEEKYKGGNLRTVFATIDGYVYTYTLPGESIFAGKTETEEIKKYYEMIEKAEDVVSSMYIN